MIREEPVGLIGLGLMGTALAGRFLDAGRSVLGYDVDAARCEALVRAGGLAADNCAGVARACPTIVLSLPTTEVVERVVAEMEGHLTASTTLIDTTTGDPEKVERLARRLADRGIHYLDATISGSSADTAKGEVIVLVGGPRQVFQACEDLFRCFVRRSFHLGDSGSGTRMKLVTNLVLGLNRAALAEGLALAAAMGLDTRATLTILSQSAAYSRVMDTKGGKMVHGDFAPQGKLSQHLKDVRLIQAEGVRHRAALPLTQVHRELLERLEEMGLGEADNSAIIHAFQRSADHASEATPPGADAQETRED